MYIACSFSLDYTPTRTLYAFSDGSLAKPVVLASSGLAGPEEDARLTGLLLLPSIAMFEY